MNTESNVGEKTKFKCETCGKYSKTKQNLNTHIRTHTGEKPYDCKECEQAFAQIGQLNAHILAIHTREKNYRCDVCGKEFVSNGILKKHTRTHTGEKPYCCKVCGIAFTQRGSLNRHIRTIHSGVIPYYQCELCEKTFANKSNLSKHFKVHIKSSTDNIQNKGDSNESVMGNPSSSSSSVNLIFDSNATSNEIQTDKYVLPHLNIVPCPNPIIYQSEMQSHSHDAQTNINFNDNMMMTPSPSINSQLTDESVTESLPSTLDVYKSR